MNWPIFFLGVVVIALTAANVLFTMVLPRRPFGVDRLTLTVNRTVLRAMNLLAHFARTYEWKDAILSPAGPIALVLQLLLWAGGLTLGWEVDPDPDPEGQITDTFEEYAQAIEKLAEVGFPMERSAEESWPDFRGWRVNYETVAYRLADRLTAPPAPWSGPRRHLRGGPVLPKRPPQRHPGERPRRTHATVGPPPRRLRLFRSSHPQSRQPRT